ncbi:MAG: hypothetical protein U0X93_02690 [Anaerolineales bacterium]
MSAIDIAREIQDAKRHQATFTILAGWRMEEIAASLPTSGLAISPDDFLAAARTPRDDYDFLLMQILPKDSFSLIRTFCRAIPPSTS